MLRLIFLIPVSLTSSSEMLIQGLHFFKVGFKCLPLVTAFLICLLPQSELPIHWRSEVLLLVSQLIICESDRLDC